MGIALVGAPVGRRVGELCSLRWRDVDLASGKLAVADSKTDAGRRVVDVTPMLLDELKLHRADSEQAGPDDLVFGTSRGTPRNRSNIYEAGATTAYVMAQMGHTDASLALEVYSKVMERKRDTGVRMDALIRGADWAQMGTNGPETVDPPSALATENPAGAGLF